MLHIPPLVVNTEGHDDFSNCGKLLWAKLVDDIKLADAKTIMPASEDKDKDFIVIMASRRKVKGMGQVARSTPSFCSKNFYENRSRSRRYFFSVMKVFFSTKVKVALAPLKLRAFA